MGNTVQSSNSLRFLIIAFSITCTFMFPYLYITDVKKLQSDNHRQRSTLRRFTRQRQNYCHQMLENELENIQKVRSLFRPPRPSSWNGLLLRGWEKRVWKEEGRKGIVEPPIIIAARRNALGWLLLWRRGCLCGWLCVCHVDVVCPNDWINHRATSVAQPF